MSAASIDDTGAGGSWKSDATPTAVNDEIAAMRRLVNALDGLPDDATRRRVLTWLTDRYGHDTPKENA